MKLEKAKEVICDILRYQEFYPGTDKYNAIQLGNHAINEVTRLRSDDRARVKELLPGETPSGASP